MSVKLFNKKTGVTAACERKDWAKCRDHNPSKGWNLWTPESMSNEQLEKSGLVEKKENRNNPPYILRLEESEGSVLLLDENGKLYTKFYDDYGNGAGSFPALKLGKGRMIKEAVAAAWKQYDEEQAARAEREKDNPYKDYMN
jgi:hypothetical protein